MDSCNRIMVGNQPVTPRIKLVMAGKARGNDLRFPIASFFFLSYEHYTQAYPLTEWLKVPPSPPQIIPFIGYVYLRASRWCLYV